jgi:hypothetical protein
MLAQHGSAGNTFHIAHESRQDGTKTRTPGEDAWGSAA